MKAKRDTPTDAARRLALIREDPAADIRRALIPSAKQEALQEPAFDPIMLLVSLASGGLSALPEGLENQTIKRAALSKLAGEPDEFIRKFMSRLAEQTPSLLQTTAKGAGAAGGRFTGANALSNLIDPNHPTANNVYALANAPRLNVEKLPRLVQLLKRLQAQMDQNLNPEHIP